jgi:hypothetical protein
MGNFGKCSAYRWLTSRDKKNLKIEDERIVVDNSTSVQFFLKKRCKEKKNERGKKQKTNNQQQTQMK